MKQLIKEFKKVVNELHIVELEDIDLLLKLTVDDIENQTDLSYKVTPILEKLKYYSDIYVHLDEDEQTELLRMNQTNFFNKIFYVIRLANRIIDELLICGILHPVIEGCMVFEDMLDTEEDFMELLEEIKEMLPAQEIRKEKIQTYRRLVVAEYQQNLTDTKIPNLLKAMITENYQMALEELSTYIQKKLELESGMEKTCSLITSYLYQALLDMKDSKCIERLLAKVEESEFDYYGVGEGVLDLDELDNNEYFNLLLLQLDNRYRRQKSAYYFYGEKQKKITEYQEKCKKL